MDYIQMNYIQGKPKKSIQNMLSMLPIILTAILVPLVVRMKELHAEEEYYLIFTPVHEFLDFFSYYKMIILLLCTCLAMILFLHRIFKEGFEPAKKDIFYVCLFIYTLLAAFSALFSQYREVAFFGFLDRHEGILSLLAYVFLCFYTLYMVESYAQVKLILWAVFTGAVIVCTIGVFQYVGWDVFKTELGRRLIVPEAFAALRNGLEFRFGKNVIYATLFHYNYVGSYIALLLPLSAILAILHRSLRMRLIFIPITLLLSFVWLGSNARSGWVAVLLTGLVMLSAFSRQIFKNKRALWTSGIGLLVIIMGLSFFAREALLLRFQNTLAELRAASTSHADLPLQDIQIRGNEITYLTREYPFKAIFEGENELFFFNLQNQPMPYTMDSETGDIRFGVPGYDGYHIRLVEKPGIRALVVRKEPIRIYAKMSDGKFSLVNPAGQSIAYAGIESLGFEGSERFASARGYIWSRTLPILKQTLFLGKGPDNFIFYFPQGDIIGKLKAYQDMWITVDKPHNFYLQQAVNTGVLSLLCLGIVFGVYLYQSFRCYAGKTLTEPLQIIGLGCMAGVMGYLIAAVFNDSIVGVAPIFWILLGLGIAVNRQCKA